MLLTVLAAPALLLALLAAALALLLVALAAAVAAAPVTTVAAVTTVTAVTTVAATALAAVGVGAGVALALRLLLRRGVGLRLAGLGGGVAGRAARVGGGAATTALGGGVVAGLLGGGGDLRRLAGDVDLLLVGGRLLRLLLGLAGLLRLLGGGLVARPGREVLRRFGLVSPAVSAAAGAALAEDPPAACASLMTSISWLLRIRAVPLMPRPDATCCSSASTMPSRPVPRRRREPAPVAGAEASVAGAAAVSSTRAPIRSVVSLTKGPSLERTSACLARRPVVLSGFGSCCANRAGAVVRLNGGRDIW